MEIRNRDDAEFIIRHRAGVELGKQWKRKGRMLFLLLMPIIIYCVCMMAHFPSAGTAGHRELPDAVSLGLVVLGVWIAIPLAVAMVCYGKDKDYLVKKYMDEATKAGTIDKEK